MAGNASEESAAGRSLEGMSNGQRYQSGDALVEWRSSEQVENGTPSTSPPYWDTDDSDDDGGPKPMQLFGKFTWKIEKFSQVNKRELRSNPFEIGGYKWYILIYPQGCDVCNHLSLFLCVANHDKLLPGWSHFAQFTIAVVNKDPKKSKYSDTLHRFWKKEHDWGWKKFMELSKVSDGFLDSDALVIKAQVQVIREKADRPFRCLDCHYRRELVRVYLTNVEQICRRFVEERRTKLEKLIDDKARWSSFCAFWLGIDQNARRRMSREKMDMILKIIVKNFFIEKEVTSTLVMDSLYSGLKALEDQSKCKKGKGKLMDGEDAPAPIVRVEKDVFVLVDDVLLLLKRAALEPLPPKDEKGPQNRTKEGGSGEDFSKDTTIERDEIRLTELGRRTVEIFVLAHIFSNKIEVAYQEAVALKRQEELIREEEAAWLAESEQKAKRGVSDREKKSKKKQGKQKRNNRKGKDKVKDEKSNGALQDKRQPEVVINQEKNMVRTQAMVEKEDALEDVSDVSDSVECATDMLHADSEDREASPVNWDTDTSEVHPPGDAGCSEISNSLSTVQTRGFDKRSSLVIDDSSSTCSTDSTPSVVMNGSNRGNSSPSCKFQGSPTRGKNQRGKVTSVESSRLHGADSGLTERIADVGHYNDYSPTYKVVGSNDSEGCATSLQDRTRWPELVKKEEEVVLLRRKPGNKDQADVERHSREKIRHSPRSPPKITAQVVHLKSEPKAINSPDVLSIRSSSSNSSLQTDRVFVSSNASQPASVPRPDSMNTVVLKPAEKFSGLQAPVMSRPSSAPVIPATKSAAAVVSMVHSVPTTLPLSRSVSAAGRLGLDPPSAAHASVPQSYRNAIIGSSNTGISHPPPSPTSLVSHSASTVINHSVNLVANASPPHSQQAVSASAYTPQVERLDTNGGNSGISFGTPTQGVARSGRPWMENPQRDISRTMSFDSASSLNEIPSFELYRPVMSRSPEFPAEFSVSTSGRHSQSFLGSEFSQAASVRHMATQSMMADEFPHLDIINDLLDDEQGIGRNTECSFFPGLGSSAGLFSQRFHVANDMGMPADVGSSTSSCRYDMSGGYHEDGLPRDYGSGSQFDAPREYIPQSNLLPYLNGQIDSMVPNQWQVAGPDLSLLNLRNSGGDGYLYNVPEYSNLACDMNGYAIFRPSNRH